MNSLSLSVCVVERTLTIQRKRLTTSPLAQSPGVFFVESIEERFQLFHTFTFTQDSSVGLFEKSRSEFDEPFWVDGDAFTHVFFGRQDEFVVNDPIWLALK